MDVSVDDPARDDRIIIQNFMKELCRKDHEDNLNPNRDPDRTSNVFPIEEIRSAVLDAYSLDRVKSALGRHILEADRDNPSIEFSNNESSVS